jgi:hypothetical protein
MSLPSALLFCVRASPVSGGPFGVTRLFDAYRDVGHAYDGAARCGARGATCLDRHKSDPSLCSRASVPDPLP